MKRRAEDDLLTWYNKKSRLPMIIRGARQVGKSTLVRLFCKRNNIDILEINLERVKLNSAKSADYSISRIVDEIQLITKKNLSSRSLIFLDEIQESTTLLKALRYFYEERPEIPIIAAGSLLEITLKKGVISFPVGRVEFYHLGPMSFTEFLWATGNELLEEKILNLDSSEVVHDLAKKCLKTYFYVGGMPKAVKTYVEEDSLLAVRNIQDQIIQTYRADFPKYNSRIQVERIERVFLSSINNLSKKIVYKSLDPLSYARDVRRIIELLVDARVLTPCRHTSGNSIPLAGESDDSIYKLYFLDIGLVNSILKLDISVIDDEFKNNFNTKGLLAEQFIAQHLAYLDNERLGPELFYWLRDKGAHKGEIDFLIQHKDKIIPLEVKAQAVGHLKSLFHFSKDKNKDTAIRFSLEPYSVQEHSHLIDGKDVKIRLINIPHYFIESLYKLL